MAILIASNVPILFQASRDVVVSLEQTIYYRGASAQRQSEDFSSAKRHDRLRLDTPSSRWI